MRPILYNANETAFETYGLGEIDATKAQVTRERNGNYTLYIEYPASGPLAGTFKNDMRIKSDAGLRTKNQTFFISRIVKDSTGILKVYAKHISHLTETMAIRNNTNATGTAQSALATWASNCLGGIRFDVWSDIELSSRTSWNIADFKTARDVLGGVSGSILDVWGGEFEFDNTTIRLHKQLGRRSPIVLEYGRNILRAEDDRDIESAYTSVYPYATYTPENQGTGEGGATSQQITVELPEKYVDGPYIGLYNERRVLIVDFSSNFKEKEVPTIDKLRRLAKEYAINNRLGLPKINTKIEYVDLSKTLDYKLTQILEEAELCDIVPVYYPQIGLTSEDAKLTTIVYDVLLEQNDSVEVGVVGDGFKSSMTSNLSGKIDDLASNQQRLVNTLPDYLLNAQGNKVWYNRPDNKEHKIGDIWFEKNGLYDRMYVWNGSMWEKRIDTEDVDRVKKEVDKQLEQAKTTTDRAISEANVRSAEALARANASADLGREAKRIADENVNNLNTFKATAERAQTQLSKDVTTFKNEYGSKMLEVDQTTAGIKTKIGEITSFVEKDGQRQEELKRYAREETASLSTTIRETLSRDYISKSTFTENAEGTRQRFEALTRDNEAKLAEFKQGIDGQLTTLSSQIAGKVNETDFQRVKENSLLYERIIGTSETDAPDRLSRLVMSSDIFQTEVGRYVADDNNLIVNSMTMATNTLVNSSRKGVDIFVKDGVFTIKAQGLTSYNFSGFTLPIYVKKIYRGETYTLGFKYRIREKVDTNFVFTIKNHGANKMLLNADMANANTPVSEEWQEFQRTFTVQEDFAFGEDTKGMYPFYIYMAKNGWIEFKEPILVRGSNTGPYKPSQFDDVFADNKAIRTQVSLLAGSWAVRNLNSNGDVLNSINVLADGTNRIDGRLTHITGQTKIDNAVIKDGMIANLNADKITGGTIDASQVNVINVNASNVLAGTMQGMILRGGKIEALDGSLSMDLNNKKIRLNGDNVGIVREFKGYPTQFIRYEASVENGHKHAKTIIGSNRDGTEAWNSQSFSGIVIDNNANNSLDNIYQFGDHIHFKHAQGDDGWRFSNVSQIITPGVWNKNSEIWARAFVVPKKTKGLTDTPIEFINLVDSIAALWKLWAHAKSQIGMTEAMKTVIQGSLDAWSYGRPHI
nr:MAG TPA: tail protein [Caudoviricetes sp.]